MTKRRLVKKKPGQKTTGRKFKLVKKKPSSRRKKPGSKYV